MLDGPGKNAGDAGKETVRRKRFQRGCVREAKHRSRRVWIGKYYENGQSRTGFLVVFPDPYSSAAVLHLSHAAPQQKSMDRKILRERAEPNTGSRPRCADG